MTPEQREQMERYRAAFAAQERRYGYDFIGTYVKECVRSRQVICRDPECTVQWRCKRFPAELRKLANNESEHGRERGRGQG